MKLPDPTVIRTDVLVVGGGLGGVRAALRAQELGADVTVVEKAVISRAGPMTYVHSQFAPYKLLEGDELRQWMEEFVVGANYLADQEWLEVYLREAYFRVQELVHMGVPYVRDEQGRLKYSLVRGHKVGTTLGADGRATMEVLRRELTRRRVRLIEKVMVNDLLTTDGRHPTRDRICGAVGFHVRTGEPYLFLAKAVILNTGPFYPKIHYAYVDHCTGEGHAMAFRAGAELAGMEFAQYAAWSYFNRQFFTPGQAKIQGIGARFVNALGEEFMPRYDPIWGNFSGLFQVARAIATENLEGRGPCFVDMRHCSDEDLAVLYKVVPTLERAFKEFDIDPKKDLLRVDPFILIGTGSSSGVRVDLWSRASLPGLFAVGTCTHLPIMMTGISGSSLSTFSNVGGYRAGEKAAEIARQMAHHPPHDPQQVKELIAGFCAPLSRRGQTRPCDIWMAIGEVTAEAGFALFKNEARIARTRDRLREIRHMLLPRVTAPDVHELVKANEVANYLQMAEVACEAMLARKESRGELIRADYPYQDNDDWLRWIIVRRQGEGEGLSLSFWDLPYDRYPIPPKRGKVPLTFPIPEEYRVAPEAASERSMERRGA
ncbi:Fumarate reductase flavoprotein subunit [bacterium HR10]|nr:Fumarate reductase flavoprotein subunit [bacterium HR10]